MPKLGSIKDPVELDNLYADKVIVYVEGAEDFAFFNDLVGREMADRLEFKIPEEKGSGYHVVKSRVANERAGNPKIHGLLDGETAVSMDRFADFLASDGVLFSLAGAEHDGLMFLSEHELENIVLCHARVPEFLSAHVPFVAIGSRPVAVVERELVTLARRFYLLALLKFAAGRFHAAGTPCKAVDQYSGLFDTPQGVAQILRFLRPRIVAAGIDWPTFIAAIRTFASSVRGHFEQRGFDEEERRKHVLRMSDGKNFLKRVRGKYHGSPSWEGALTGRVKSYGYVARFRTALEAATGCNDNG